MKTIIIFLSLLLSLQGFTQEICNDGVDNDGDGLIDCADISCTDAECQNAITCPETITLFQVLEGKDFVKYNPLTLSYQMIYQNTLEINAIGYNPNDGYIYGIRRNMNHLMKVGADGIFQDLGPVPGLPMPETNYFVGDIGLDGILYVTNSVIEELYAIDIVNMSATTISMSEPLGSSDFACNVNDGLLYSLNNETGALQDLNTKTGLITNHGPLTPPIACGRGYGAGFSDKNGDLYFFCNSSGNLYKVDPINKTSILLQATGIDLFRNDGAACPFADKLVLPSASEFCCDSDNLIANPSFEGGNAEFDADYNYTTTRVAATDYTITNTQGANGYCSSWNVEDPTTCVNGSNGNFLVTNGLTSQASNTNNVIWEQTIPNMEVDSQYRFCAKFKHLPVGCFDVAPSVAIEITSNGGLSWTTISTSATDPCDWEELSFDFTASSPSETIRIMLDQTALNDGNDLAIDDIGLFKKSEQNLLITVEHNGGQKSIKASLGDPDTADDNLPSPDCKYYWLVGEVANLNTVSITNTMMGDASMGWGLTTTFPSYNGGVGSGLFESGKMYLIGFYSYECGCFASEYTYQLTFDSGKTSRTALTSDQKVALQKAVTEFMTEAIAPETDTKFQLKPTEVDFETTSNKVQTSSFGKDMQVRPNPASDQINILFNGIEAEGTVRLTDINGRQLKQLRKEANTSDLNMELDNLPSGIYILHLEAGETIISKRVIKH